jgi:hypothetical protein
MVRRESTARLCARARHRDRRKEVGAWFWASSREKGPLSLVGHRWERKPSGAWAYLPVQVFISQYICFFHNQTCICTIYIYIIFCQKTWVFNWIPLNTDEPVPGRSVLETCPHRRVLLLVAGIGDIRSIRLSLSVMVQYFSLTINQRIVLSAMAFQPSE